MKIKIILFIALLMLPRARCNPISAAALMMRNVPIKATGFNPASDAAVLEWLDANTVGNSSTDWINTVGQDATAAVASAPVLTSGVFHGNFSYVFNGINARMTNASTFTTASQPYWIICVYSLTTVTASGILFEDNSTTTALKLLSSALKFSAGGTSQTIQATADTSWHILAIYASGASSGYILDGGTFTAFSSTPGTAGMSRVVLASVPGGGTFATINWGVFGVATAGSNSTLGSGTTISSVISYLDSEWTIF